MRRRVVMSKTAYGSENGFSVSLFELGQEYDISERLADVFVNQMGVASFTDIVNATDTHELKMVGPSPENKMVFPFDNKDTDVKKRFKLRRS